MPKIFREILKYSFIFAIMGYLLYDTFSKIDPQALGGKTRWQFLFSYWQISNKFYIFLSVLCAILSHIIRALRWKIVLEPIGYRNISTFNATMAVLNGYFYNLFIPRGGEITRPHSLKKTDGVPMDIGVGTVVTERIIDLIFLVICIGTVFLFQADLILSFVYQGIDLLKNKNPEDRISWTKILILSLVFLGFFGIILLYFLKKELFVALYQKAKDFSKGMWTGITSILKLEKRALFIFYSLLIWVLYYGMIFTILLAFPETTHIKGIDALTVFVTGGIAMALPLPGGTGSYHVMVSYAVSQLGSIPMSSSIAIVTLLHAIHTVLLIVTGGASVYFISKNTKYGDKK